jgi:hypothetical protein
VRAFIGFLMKIVLTLSSFSGVLYFYFVINQFNIPYLKMPAALNQTTSGFTVKNLLAVIVLLLFSYLSLLLAKAVFRPGETLNIKEVKSIEAAAMPTYIGLFVIALGLGEDKIREGLTILAVLFVLWGLFERVFYFNPIWLFFGYRFYEIRTQQDNTFTLVARKSSLKGEMQLTNLRRINNYTFLEAKS